MNSKFVPTQMPIVPAPQDEINPDDFVHDPDNRQMLEYFLRIICDEQLQPRDRAQAFLNLIPLIRHSWYIEPAPALAQVLEHILPLMRFPPVASLLTDSSIIELFFTLLRFRRCGGLSLQTIRVIGRIFTLLSAHVQDMEQSLYNAHADSLRVRRAIISLCADELPTVVRIFISYYRSQNLSKDRHDIPASLSSSFWYKQQTLPLYAGPAQHAEMEQVEQTLRDFARHVIDHSDTLTTQADAVVLYAICSEGPLLPAYQQVLLTLLSLNPYAGMLRINRLTAANRIALINQTTPDAATLHQWLAHILRPGEPHSSGFDIQHDTSALTYVHRPVQHSPALRQEILQTISHHDAFWEQPSTLLSMHFGLPDDRTALQALHSNPDTEDSA